MSVTGESRDAEQRRVRGTAQGQGAWSPRRTSWSFFTPHPFSSWETWTETAGKYIFGVHVS